LLPPEDLSRLFLRKPLVVQFPLNAVAHAPLLIKGSLARDHLELECGLSLFAG
jgi:hypothetical protein